MNINRINNIYHNEIDPSISTKDIKYYFTRNKLHRGSGLPAIISKYSKSFFWRGIHITEDIATRQLHVSDILKIENVEVRQAAIEILGYKHFFKFAKLIHKFTPAQFINDPKFKEDMYQLYKFDFKKDEFNEEIKILMMIDPSKFPITKYFIRVAPQENDCCVAVAHSYGFSSFDDFIKDKVWS